MNDLISRQALLDKFEQWQKNDGYSNDEWNLLVYVLSVIKSMPPAPQLSTNLAEVGTDLISRQAAIAHAVPLNLFGREVMMVSVSELEQLPPAQPEIIRCKDCKHWDGVDACDVIDVPVWDNDFCSMAERRSDEE